MNNQPVHPSASGKRGAIRYSLCVLIAAVAAAFTFNGILYLFLSIARKLAFADLLRAHPYMDGDFLASWILPTFIAAAIAVIAWHFRRRPM
jgi:ABC-type multidrug transport system permease subunit